ncbi:major facilitator superfamily domain-containing protein [Phycomyces blakesleeanus]
MPHFIGLKLLSVFSIGSLVASQLFLPLFFKDILGLGSDKIGMIFSIIPFTSCIAFPYWTHLADRTHAYKTIMISNMFIALFSILSIGLVPFITNQESTTIVLVALGCFGYAFCGYPMISAMVDCVTLRALGDDKALYGRQKIGCPIGVSSAIFLVGLLQETFETQYALFWVYAVYVLGFIATIAAIDLTPHRYPKPVDEEETPLLPDPASAATLIAVGSTTPSLSENGVEKQDKSMWHLFRQPESMHFYTVVAILGFCFSTFQIFLFMFIRNDLHGTPAMIGLLGPLSGFSELLVFFFSKQVNQQTIPIPIY